MDFFCVEYRKEVIDNLTHHIYHILKNEEGIPGTVCPFPYCTKFQGRHFTNMLTSICYLFRFC